MSEDKKLCVASHTAKDCKDVVSIDNPIHYRKCAVYPVPQTGGEEWCWFMTGGRLGPEVCRGDASILQVFARIDEMMGDRR